MLELPDREIYRAALAEQVVGCDLELEERQRTTRRRLVRA